MTGALPGLASYSRSLTRSSHSRTGSLSPRWAQSREGGGRAWKSSRPGLRWASAGGQARGSALGGLWQRSQPLLSRRWGGSSQRVLSRATGVLAAVAVTA